MGRINKLKLLEILQKDGRITFAELARLLQVTETAVRKVYRKLVDEGVIVGVTTIVDYEALANVEHPKKVERWLEELKLHGKAGTEERRKTN